MNLVDVEADVKAIAHLDFDLTCEVRVQSVLVMFGMVVGIGPASRPCGQSAVGYIRCSGCGHAALSCDQHRALCVSDTAVTCSICQKTGPASSVYAFEPLKVRS